MGELRQDSTPEWRCPPCGALRGRKTGLLRTARTLAFCLGVSVAGAAAASGTRAAWTHDAVSHSLQHPGYSVTVRYAPSQRQRASVPPGARITQVYASRSYDGPARVRTQVCWQSERGPCVPLAGHSINTHALDGLAAAGPVLLVHQLMDWGGGHAPLFIRGTVTVWYETTVPEP